MKNEVDAYISQSPKEIQVLLSQVRAAILEAAPDSEESIKYAIPTYFQLGNLVHFAAHKNHIGFYPAPSGLKAFQEEIQNFARSKGAVQFPFDKEIPLDWIKKTVKFRLQENRDKAKKKSLRTRK